MISHYFTNIGNITNSFDLVVKSDIQTRKINDFIGIIEGKVNFENFILDFLEVIKLSDKRIIKSKYKYHFQTMEGEMIFRYDNAPHHQNVLTFPHHKHIGNGIIDSIEPDIETILSEIKFLLIKY